MAHARRGDSRLIDAGLINALPGRHEPREVAVWLRGQGHDAVHLRELGLQEQGDEAVLANAVAEKRVALTLDRDFAGNVRSNCRPRA